MTKPRPKRCFWSAVDEELLRQAYATTLTVDLAKVLGRTPSQVLAKAHDMGPHKTTEHVAELARKRTMAPGHGSQRTRIAPGTAPWNKGVKGVTGTQEACRATGGGESTFIESAIGASNLPPGITGSKVHRLGR